MQSMSCVPLAKINDFVEECEAEFRKIQKTKEPFAFVKASLLPADAKLLQEAAYEPHDRSQTVYRKEFTKL